MPAVTFALARSLLLADAVTPEALSQALLVAATRGTTLVRALLATRAIDAMRLEQQLERGEAPTMRHVAPVMSLVENLPPGLCDRLLALPVRRDPRTGTVDVAVVDARDPHPVEEIAYWLRAPVRMVRTSLAAMDAALRRMHEKPEPGPRSLSPPIWVPPGRERIDVTKTPAYGSPAATPEVIARAQAAAPEPFEEEEEAEEEEAERTEVHDFGLAGPNIPFALTRLSLPAIPVEMLQPAEERGSVPPDLPHEPIELRRRSEPVLDLRRRKSIVPSPPPMPFPPVGPTLDAIRAAADRDAILEQVVAGVKVVARRVGVLAVRKEVLVGWTCSPELADRATLRTARIAPFVSEVLTQALASPSATLARIPKDAAHAPLLAAMKVPPSGEVAFATVRVDGKAVALVLADELGDSLLVDPAPRRGGARGGRGPREAAARQAQVGYSEAHERLRQAARRLGRADARPARGEGSPPQARRRSRGARRRRTALRPRRSRGHGLRRRARPRRAGAAAVHPRRAAQHVPRAPLDHAPVRGLRHRGGVERALPLPAVAGADGPVASPSTCPPRWAATPTIRAPLGEVGRVGVAIDSIEDMRTLLARAAARQDLHVDDHQRHRGDPALPLHRGGRGAGRAARGKLRGTIQNDILKEYIARGTYIYPPRPVASASSPTSSRSARERCPSGTPSPSAATTSARPAATPSQEVAFTLADGIAYVEGGASRRGSTSTRFGAQLSFFFNVHNNLLEEVAKFRAARRMWSAIMKDRFGAKTDRARALRFHCQTAGMTLTAQQPLVNVVRVTVQTLAAVLGGCQSLHTN